MHRSNCQLKTEHPPTPSYYHFFVQNSIAKSPSTFAKCYAPGFAPDGSRHGCARISASERGLLPRWPDPAMILVRRILLGKDRRRQQVAVRLVLEASARPQCSVAGFHYTGGA